jgi:hypothetical protein
MKLIVFILPLLLLQQNSFANQRNAMNDTTTLETILRKSGRYFDSILNKKDDLRIQIIYTQINRDKNNVPHFKDFSFNVDANKYFYPASTVKMPIAFLALEKINELKVEGLNRSTAMITDSNFARQSAVYVHPLSENGAPSVEHYVKQIFLVSDNDAFNRLYEFITPAEINRKMKAKGFNETVIRHRLNLPMSDIQYRNTNAVSFRDTSGNIIWSKPAETNETVYPEIPAKLGNGFMRSGKLVSEPFDFTLKNRVALNDLHQMLRSSIFPKETGNKFNLTEDDYKLVHKYMSMHCTESKFPSYDSSEYWPSYVKFLLYGSEKGDLPSNIRIFNKVGDAYGFLTDVAYIVDFATGTEFFLSCNIYCNADGVFNDDKYDYDTVGFPFMKQLGKAVYEYELKRKKKFKPNLDAFKFNYNE